MINYRPFRVFAKWTLGLAQGKFQYFNTPVYFPKNSLIFRMACEEGIYDKDVFSFIFRFLKEDGLFVDIGTNIGLLSVPVLNNFKRTKVISFEPSATVLPHLRRTHEESANKTRWTIHETALGDFTGTVSFEKNHELDSAFDSIVHEAGDPGTRDIESIPITTVDEVLNIEKNKFTSVVMKIDVEGFEYQVLKGAANFITKHKPFIVLEVVGDFLDKYKVSTAGFLTLVHSLNYDIYGLDTVNKIASVHEFELSMMKNLNFALLPREL